jgi:putative transposase
MNVAINLSAEVGKKPACEALQVPRSSFYRYLGDGLKQPADLGNHRPSPPLALSSEERQVVLDILYSDRFRDKAAHQVYAVLLDEGQYHCSVSTMYRILSSVYGNVKAWHEKLQVRYYLPI